MTHSLFTLLLSAVAALPLAAQQVEVHCTPTDGSAAGCYYCPGFETVIKWNGARLHSSTINLVPFHDLDVVVQGTWNGTQIEVTSIQVTTESFTISGNGSIGNHFDFTSFGASGGLALDLVALGTSFMAIGSLALQLDPVTAVILGAGALNGAGEFKSRLDIPNNPSLVGLRLDGQGVILQPGGVIYTTNVDSKVIN